MRSEHTERTQTMQNQFWVTVTRPIPHPKVNIKAGDSLLVDCEKSPEVGNLVLSDSRIEPWSGQENIQGVVIKGSFNVSLKDEGLN